MSTQSISFESLNFKKNEFNLVQKGCVLGDIKILLSGYLSPHAPMHLTCKLKREVGNEPVTKDFGDTNWHESCWCLNFPGFVPICLA